MRKHLRLAVAGTAARAAAGIVALGLFAGTGFADPIAALDHAEYAERERASERLIEAVNGELKRLEAMIRDRELTPEQRARLEAIGWELFRRGPRAGIGVQFGGRDVARGVQISGTVVGFDAHDVLAADDVILEMNGRELDSIDTMRFLIVARDPGDVMRLRVLRQGREIDAAVRMGSFAQLQGPSQMDQGVLEGAWRFRLAEWGEEEHRSIAEAKLPGPPPAVNAAIRRTEYEGWLAQGEPLPPVLTAGGEPTGGLAACGRLRVLVGGRDLLMPPIRYGIEALREQNQPLMIETVRTELSLISQAISLQARMLREEMINADAERREQLAEKMQLLDERARNATNRANEMFDLYDRMPRGR